MGSKEGRVLVITGDGKGKTTAALGVAMRAYGHGMRICIVQFIKEDCDCGEHRLLRLLRDRIDLFVSGCGFYGLPGDTSDKEHHMAAAARGMSYAKSACESGEYDMLVLDEINNAVELGLVDREELLQLIRLRPASLHLVLTGRDAQEEVMALADTVSAITAVKHAFDSGRPAQEGIDY